MGDDPFYEDEDIDEETDTFAFDAMTAGMPTEAEIQQAEIGIYG